MPSLFIDETGNFANPASDVAMVGVLLPEDGLRGDPQFVRQVLRMAVRSVPEPFHARFMYNPVFYAVCLAHGSLRQHRASLDKLATDLQQAELELDATTRSSLDAVAKGQEGGALEPGDADFLASMTGGPRNRLAIQGAAVGTRIASRVDADAQWSADALLAFWRSARRIDADAVTRAIDAGQEPSCESVSVLLRSARASMPNELNRMDDAVRQCRASISAALAMFLRTDSLHCGHAWFGSGETSKQSPAAKGETSFDRWRAHLVALLRRVAAAGRLAGIEFVNVHVLCPDSLANAARANRTTPTAIVERVLADVDPELLQLAAVANWGDAENDGRYVLADLAAMHSRNAVFQHGNWTDAKTLLAADGICATQLKAADRVGPGLPLAAAVGHAHHWLAADPTMRGHPPIGQNDRIWAWEQAMAWSEALK